MNELHNILSVFIIGGLLLSCGMMFIFGFIPADPLLGNYRKARYAMAGAYLFFLAVEILQYFIGNSSGPSVSFLQTVTLAIAAPQAFLFTFAMLALLEVRFPGWRYMFGEAAVVLIFVAAAFVAYVFCPASIFGVGIYVLAGIYALLLVRYTRLFIESYRQFSRRMDNYYSDEEAGRLRWVAVSFYCSLTIGIMALLLALSGSLLMALAFLAAVLVYYLYFAIRFLNYPYLFQAMIEQAVENETVAEAQPDGSVKTGSSAFAMLEQRIELWVADKEFTQQGVTIEILAAKLITNQKYLSTYINTYKKQTFRKWINGLRIEEAKIILLQDPKTTLTDVAHRTGFSEKSHFIRRFKEQTGVSPTEWRNRVRAQGFQVLPPELP